MGMQATHKLYMMIDVEDQPLRLIFLGDMNDAEQHEAVDAIRGPDRLPLRFRILEKFRDGDFRYTIISLACDDADALDDRLEEMFPEVRRLRLTAQDDLRAAVRAIVI